VSSTDRIDQETVRERLRVLLDERLEELTRSLKQIVTETAPPAPDLGPLAAFASHAERSADQVAILERLVEEASRTARRAMLFVVKGATLRGWAARGMPGTLNPKSITRRISPDDLIGRAVEAAAAVSQAPGDTPGNAALAASLGDEAPDAMFAAPLWVRDRVAAVLYTDTAAGEAWQPDAAAVMASIAALSLEAVPYRAKHPRPAEQAPQEPVTTSAPTPSEDASADHAMGHEPASPRPASAAAMMSVGGAGAEEDAPTQAGSQEALDPEEAALHEEARRFAALLASEIVLYNEKQLEEGRRNKDLYERLKDDIDRSYRMFEQRISSKLSGATRYFKEEILRALANGDESALRLPWE